MIAEMRDIERRVEAMRGVLRDSEEPT